MTREPPTNYLRDVQYRTPDKLLARVSVHVLFSTNDYGWPRWLFDRLELPDESDILEIGCGPATLWKSNATKVPVGWRLTLTDFSPGMIQTAKANLEHGLEAVLEVADAQNLPFPEGSFDAVLAHHMLYHVPDKRAALSEIKRVLRGGGVLYAATNGPNHLRQLWELILKFAPTATSTVNSDSFDLVNGPNQIGEFLNVIEVQEYPDSLAVTETDPLMDYIRSMSIQEITESQLATIQDSLSESIRREGAFHIDKQAGLITAVRL